MADDAFPQLIATFSAGSGLVETLAAIGQATGVARSSMLYAAVSAGHVLGIALLLGPIILADLAIIGVVWTLEARAVATLRWTARIGVALAIATGILLVSSKPAEYLSNWAFMAKLGFAVLAVLNAAVFEWRAKSNHGSVARLQAVASIALWLTVLGLGRWIAFV